jgi:hypothetical protein
MKMLRTVTVALGFLILSGCATTSVVTRPPRFTEAFDSKDGLVLIHDGLPGDRLILGAEGSNWEFTVGVPHRGESWLSGGTAPRTKVIGNRFLIIENPDWEVTHQIRIASEMATGTPEVVLGTVTLEGKSRPFVVHIKEADEED